MSAALSRALSPPAQQSSWTTSWAVAAGAHLCAAVLFAREPPPAPISLVTEVELVPSAALPTPPAAAEVPPPSAPDPEATKPQPRAARVRLPIPAAARAGELRTAAPDPAASDPEPMRFISDPSGRGYGHGVVARGGQVDHGTGSEPRPLAPASPSERFTPAERLRRQPSLLGDGCAGYFPAQARPNTGQVALLATLHASGAIARIEIESETPQGEGFAAAARACLTRRRFSPALNERGQPTATRARINLRFSR